MKEHAQHVIAPEEKKRKRLTGKAPAESLPDEKALEVEEVEENNKPMMLGVLNETARQIQRHIQGSPLFIQCWEAVIAQAGTDEVWKAKRR